MLPASKARQVSATRRVRPAVEVTAATQRTANGSGIDTLSNRIYAAIARVTVEHGLPLDHGDIRKLADGLKKAVLQLPYREKRMPERRLRPRTFELSDREKRSLIGVAMGLQSQEIGEQLGLSSHTVKTHLGNVYAALGARNAPHAVSIALRMGIITNADFTPTP